MKISCVMPFYNNGKYLEDAICSVLDSTVQNLELILVDDGSSDNSVAIAQKYASKFDNIKLYFHTKNLGPAKALKTCLHYSQGEYILFTAADDISFPFRAELCLEAFNQNPKVGMVISEAVVINEESKLTNEYYRIPHHINSMNIVLEQFKRNYCLGATIAIKNVKNLINNPSILNYSDDYELSLEYILAGYDIEIIKNPLLKYRIHSNSASNNKSLLYENTQKGLIRFCSEKIKNSLVCRDFSPIDVNISIGIFNLFRGNLEEGLKYFNESIDQIHKENTVNNNQYFELFFYLGVALYKKGDLIHSLDAFSKASQYNPKEPTLLNNLAVLYARLDINSEKVKKLLDQSIEIQPYYLDAHKNKELLINNFNINGLKLTERILAQSMIIRENYIV